MNDKLNATLPVEQKISTGEKIKKFFLDNIVSVIFVALTVTGLLVSDGVSLNFFLGQLAERFFRNAFLVLALIIPAMAGLGLNFGIVVGAIAGQLAIVFVRYFGMGGVGALLLCCLVALPLALLFGFLTGKLYNKTRGQEMIASLIVGYFASGIYQFLLLFVVGVVIPVAAVHPLITPFTGVGIRSTVDLGSAQDGGLMYALDGILYMPLMLAILIIAGVFLAYNIVRFVMAKKKSHIAGPKKSSLILSFIICVAIIVISAHAMITQSALTIAKDVPVVTGVLVVLLCLFTHFIMKTKLGQDFRSVGQSQSIADAAGINVDKTRIIATVISTVLAAWGMIIYLQNMGTLSTYTSHLNIGIFSVASILVGGASTSHATIKHAIIGTLLFNAMTIVSPEFGFTLFGDAGSGEYFRTFMVYGVIGVALGLYVWKANKAKRNKVE